MDHKIIIEKCANNGIAEKVANEVSAFSNASKDDLINALMENSISIRLDASEGQLNELQKKISELGASLRIQKIGPAAQPAYDDDEEEDCPSDPANLINNVDARRDIFQVDDDRRLLWTIVVSIVIGVACGLWFNGMDFMDFSPDFFERLPPERTAKLVIDVPKIEKEKDKVSKKKKKKSREKNLAKKKKRQKPKGASAGGGGDPRARITRKGVLGIISGKVKGKTVVGGDVLGKGGFAKDIDAILEGVGGLKRGGTGGTGRKGLAGIGFGRGYGSGFGGGSGGIDDLIGGLFGGAEDIGLKKRGRLKVEAPKTVSSGPMSGGRTRESIMRVVMQHIAGLRYAYNKRLKAKPGLNGKIKVRFSIDAPGRVIKATVIRSTMGDSVLEKEIISQILRWRFDPVEKGVDVVEYPFAFFK